jgi:hypothetical protein
MRPFLTVLSVIVALFIGGMVYLTACILPGLSYAPASLPACTPRAKPGPEWSTVTARMRDVLKDISNQNIERGDSVYFYDESETFAFEGYTTSTKDGGVCLTSMSTPRFFATDSIEKKQSWSREICDKYAVISPNNNEPILTAFGIKPSSEPIKLRCFPSLVSVRQAEQSNQSRWSSKVVLASMEMDVSVDLLSQRLKDLETDPKGKDLPSSAAGIVQRGNRYELEAISEKTCDGYRRLEFKIIKLPAEVQE